VEFVVGKVALGKVFSEYFGFLYQFSFHQISHTHISAKSSGIHSIISQKIEPFTASTLSYPLLEVFQYCNFPVELYLEALCHQFHKHTATS
jgi:hypothetical protein